LAGQVNIVAGEVGAGVVGVEDYADYVASVPQSIILFFKFIIILHIIVIIL
jgi:hypothetical protein